MRRILIWALYAWGAINAAAGLAGIVIGIHHALTRKKGDHHPWK